MCKFLISLKLALTFVSTLTSSLALSSDAPADLIFKNSDAGHYVLSADGEYLASMRSTSSGNFVVLVNIASMTAFKKINIGSSWPRKMRWKDGRLIIEFGRSITLIDKGNDAMQWLMTATTSPTGKRLKSRMQWQLINSLPEEKEYILVRATGRKFDSTYRYNLYSGEFTQVDNLRSFPKDSEFRFDHTGKLKLGFIRKDHLLKIYSTSDNDHEEVLSFNTEGPYDYTGKNLSFLSRRAEIFGITDSMDSVFIAHNLEDNRYTLYRYKLDGSSSHEQVFSSEKYDIGGSYLETLLKRDSRNSLLGISYFAEQHTSHWFDDRLNKTQKILDNKFPGSSNQIIDYSDDIDTVVFINRQENRGKIYIYQSSIGKFTLYSDRSSWLNDYELPKTQYVQYQSKDGLYHDAYLRLPVKKEPIAGIIMPGGNRFSRATNNYNEWATYFASIGYAVLEINHRGKHGYGREYFRSGILDSFDLATRDIRDAAKWFNGNVKLKNKNIFLLGEGNQGFLALLSSKNSPHMFAGVAALSFPFDMSYQLKKYRKNDSYSLLEYYGVASNNDKKTLSNLSPYKFIPEIDVPLAIFYGEDSSYLNNKHKRFLEALSDDIESLNQINFIKSESNYISKDSNKVYVGKRIDDFFLSILNGTDRI